MWDRIRCWRKRRVKRSSGPQGALERQSKAPIRSLSVMRLDNVALADVYSYGRSHIGAAVRRAAYH